MKKERIEIKLSESDTKIVQDAADKVGLKRATYIAFVVLQQAKKVLNKK